MKISVTSVNAVDGLNHWHFIGLATTKEQVEKLKSDWLVAYKADPSNAAWTDEGFFSEETREIDVQVLPPHLADDSPQAVDFNTLLGSPDGRKKLLDSLMKNDRLVQTAYRMAASEIGVEADISALHEFVVILLARALKDVQCVHIANKSEWDFKAACRVVFAGVGACSPEFYTAKIKEIAKMTGRQCDDQLMSDVRDVLAGFPCPLD